MKVVNWFHQNFLLIMLLNLLVHIIRVYCLFNINNVIIYYILNFFFKNVITILYQIDCIITNQIKFVLMYSFFFFLLYLTDNSNSLIPLFSFFFSQLLCERYLKKSISKLPADFIFKKKILI